MHLLKISEYRLIWFDDVMRKDDSDTVSMAMETNVKGKIEIVEYQRILYNELDKTEININKN